MPWIQAYDNPELVRAFERTHPLPGHIAHRMAAMLVDVVRRHSTDRQRCTVLVPGCGKGTSSVVPLIEALATRTANTRTAEQVDIIAVDSSPHMIRSLLSNLRACAARPTIRRENRHQIATRNNVSVVVIEADVESKTFYSDLQAVLGHDSLDVIFDLFLVHHLTNWRHTYDRLLRLFSETGSLVLVEFQSEYIRAIDGLGGAQSSVLGTIREFHEERWRRRGIIWAPEICASDLASFEAFLARRMRLVGMQLLPWTQPWQVATIREALCGGLHLPLYWGRDSADLKLARELLGAVTVSAVETEEGLEVREYTMRPRGGSDRGGRRRSGSSVLALHEKVARFCGPFRERELWCRRLRRRVLLQLLLTHGYCQSSTVCYGLASPTRAAHEISLLVNRAVEKPLSLIRAEVGPIAAIDADVDDHGAAGHGVAAQPQACAMFNRFDLYEVSAAEFGGKPGQRVSSVRDRALRGALELEPEEQLFIVR